jgi:hypothetical protein
MLLPSPRQRMPGRLFASEIVLRLEGGPESGPGGGGSMNEAIRQKERAFIRENGRVPTTREKTQIITDIGRRNGGGGGVAGKRAAPMAEASLALR